MSAQVKDRIVAVLNEQVRAAGYGDGDGQVRQGIETAAATLEHDFDEFRVGAVNALRRQGRQLGAQERAVNDALLQAGLIDRDVQEPQVQEPQAQEPQAQGEAGLAQEFREFRERVERAAREQGITL